MLDAELLDILVCPDTHQPLRLADEELLGEINASVSRGELRNRGGTVVTRALQAALVSEDGRRVYPVRDDIAIMLIDESIALPASS
jgi:uncharacterized protein YbaR (Trm112 family)